MSCPQFLTIRQAKGNPASDKINLPKSTAFGLKQLTVNSIYLDIQVLGCIDLNPHYCDPASQIYVPSLPQVQRLCNFLTATNFHVCFKNSPNCPVYLYWHRQTEPIDMDYILHQLKTICTFNSHKIDDVYLIIMWYMFPSLPPQNVRQLYKQVDTDMCNSAHQSPKNFEIKPIRAKIGNLTFSPYGASLGGVKIVGS